MTPEQLQKAYTHCTEMLYSTDLYKPGKYQIRKNI